MTGIRNGCIPTENLHGSFLPFRVHVVLSLELIILSGTHSARFLRFIGDNHHPRHLLKVRHWPRKFDCSPDSMNCLQHSTRDLPCSATNRITQLGGRFVYGTRLGGHITEIPLAGVRITYIYFGYLYRSILPYAHSYSTKQQLRDTEY